MKAGDKRRGRKRKEDRGGVWRGESERQSDRHRDIQRVEKTRKKTAAGVEAYGCPVCQTCDVAPFFSPPHTPQTPEYSEGDIVSVMVPHPHQKGAQLGLKLIR